jgi:hypothetical protein
MLELITNTEDGAGCFRHHMQTHLKDVGVAAMESQNLLALRSKRAEISECIRLVEARPPARAGLARTLLIERLRLKAEWLDKRLELESQQPDRFRASTGARASAN